MYTLNLKKEQLNTYVMGLDSAVKLIASQLTQGMGQQGNSLLALRNLLPKLIEINTEASNLNDVVDAADAAPQTPVVEAETSV